MLILMSWHKPADLDANCSRKWVFNSEKSYGHSKVKIRIVAK